MKKKIAEFLRVIARRLDPPPVRKKTTRITKEERERILAARQLSFAEEQHLARRDTGGEA